MSSAMKKNSTMTKKPFCKVCFDAGKDSAHPLRNATGQTVCPYLLSLQCNNCHKSGHTVKYCTSSKKMNTSTRAPQPKQAQQNQAVPNQAVPNKKKEEKQKPKSHFDVFQQLIADEEQQELERESEELARRLQEVAHKTNFPAISEKKVVAKKMSDSILTGWSRAVGKPVKVYETLSEEEEDSPAEKKLPTKPQQEQKAQVKQHMEEQHMEEQHMEEQHMEEQQEQEDLEQQMKEDDMEEDQLREDLEAQSEPEQNPYRPTYSSWADCE